MIIVVPTPQRPSITSGSFDQPGSLNQSGPSIPTQPRMTLTGPVEGLSRYTNPSVAATGGTSAGR